MSHVSPRNAAQWCVPKRASSSRPDLRNRTLLWMLPGLVVLGALALWLFRQSQPGAPLNQSAAALGSLCLLAPALFFLAKRSGASKSPPFWFVLHVLAASTGVLLICIHIAGGNLLSPAAMPLAALLFLIVQGIWARAIASRRLSFLFARSPRSFNFSAPLVIDKAALAEVIALKQRLLPRLDPDAREATFSPRLRHWLRRPLSALRYQRLADREARLVGARQRAGLGLSLWRRLHLAVAAFFYLGLLAHVVVMLLFAGYAAGGDEIYWWHLAAWGK